MINFYPNDGKTALVQNTDSEKIRNVKDPHKIATMMMAAPLTHQHPCRMQSLVVVVCIALSTTKGYASMSSRWSVSIPSSSRRLVPPGSNSGNPLLSHHDNTHTRTPSIHHLPNQQDNEDEDDLSSSLTSLSPPRGGFTPAGTDDISPQLVKTVSTITDILIALGKLVLPPVTACVRLVVDVYRALPTDAILLQTGLVYCFAGGYYPTLFSALQAAQHCGWETMVTAIGDLTNEALRVIDATTNMETPTTRGTRTAIFRQKTSIVMATVDPWKINQAAGALYMTWLGVSTVLEREYMRVITLSLTMARYINRAAQFLLAPPAYYCVEEKYHQWVPVCIGWGCKGLAMNLAWRIQRVLTAASSAITGGLMCSRALMRMLAKRGVSLFGLVSTSYEQSPLDEMLGLLVGGVGFYTQFESQWRSGFSFRVPFPISLVTWPFDWAERWIQWQITK